MASRTESPELNRRINTLIMRGLSATEATAQAKAEQDTGRRPVRPDYHKESPVTVRIPGDLLARIDQRAADEGRSRSALIIEAAEEKLARPAG